MAGPSGTVTFLFTDIEGSTRLWQEDEEAMRAALARHDDLLRSAVVDHGGTVFSTMGDGVAAVFGSAVAAVASALAAQERVGAEAWPTARPIRVRMGLHTGEAEERDGDYFGTAVNRAARLMAVGHGGQVLCSLATAELHGDAGAFVDLGRHRLRDLDRPIRVFQVGPGTFPPLRSLDVLPGNLPVQLTSFVGRQIELADVARELGAARLVTLTGVGGVGKTRLALQVAADLLPGFADGVWLCELAAAGSSDELYQVVAFALGVGQRQRMNPAESIVDFLRLRQMLVLLDNCEHLLDDVADLTQAILGAAPGVRILATSREGFGIPGEHVLPVRSLPVGGDAATGTLSDAAVLFADRARAVDPAFALDTMSIPAVVEVCRRLDGIPLAIELAAARVATLSPSEIAGHLDERFRLLTGGRRGRVERHQTLRAAIEWSYSLLVDTDRVVFGRLGVFPASFDEAGAIAVCIGGGVERWDVINALASLAAKSVVGVERSNDTTRYQLLETLRHFAIERAADGGAVEDLRRRHAAHYAAFAEQLGSGMATSAEHTWRPRLAAEMDNLRAATRWAFDAASLDDVHLGVRVLDGILNEALLQGSWGIQTWAASALPRVDEFDAAGRAAMFAACALEAYLRGDFDQAEVLAREVVTEFTGFTPMRYVASIALSLAASAKGDLLGARAVIDDCRRVLEASGGNDWRACGLQIMNCFFAARLGDQETARHEARQAVVSARRVGAPSLIAGALAAYAQVAFDDDPEEALAAADESVRLVEAGAGDSVYGAALQTAALLRSGNKDAVGAAEAASAGLQHTARSGNRSALPDSLAVAAVVVARGGAQDFEAAATLAGALSGPVLGAFPLLIGVAPRALYNQVLASAAETLGQDAYAAERKHGAAMTFPEIIAYALDRLARKRSPSSNPNGA